MRFARFDFVFLTLIFLFNFLTKLFLLNSPQSAYFDEGAFYIPAARAYLHGDFLANFQHPPVAKLFMAASIHVFGDNVWGWRIPEVLVGSLGVVFIYLLAEKMFGGKFIPVLASLFLTAEFGWFVSSRLGTIEIYVAAFSLAAGYFFWKFLKSESSKDLLLSGFFFGLAISSKWSGLFLLIFALGFYLLKKKPRSLLKIAQLITVVLLVYFASYSFYLKNHTLDSLFHLQWQMANYHLFLKSKDNLGYPPWLWFLDPPLPYLGQTVGNTVRSVIFLFNPAIFWGILGAIILVIKKRDFTSEKLFLLGAFACFWLPWFFAYHNTLQYYLLPALPFGVILLSKMIEENFEGKKFLLAGFIISCFGLFAFYYPLLTGLPVSKIYFTILTGTTGFSN